jgi:hypothetical protein
MAGEGVGVESEVGGEEGELLVDGGEDELLAGGEEDGGSLVCGCGEEDGLLPDSTENGLTALGGSVEVGVVVAVGAVVAGELSGAVLVDGGEVPPASASGKKMAPGQSGKEVEEWAGHLLIEMLMPGPLKELGTIWRWMCWLWGWRGRWIWWTASRPWAAWGRKNKREDRKAKKETLYTRVILYTGRIKGVWEHGECRKGKGERQLSQSSQATGAKESEKRPAHSH